MSDTRQQRIDVLKAAARHKSEEKTRSAEAAIARLIKRGDPVTFQAVQREAGVSHAFLYNNTRLRARIEHQRRQHRPGDAIRKARQAGLESARNKRLAWHRQNRHTQPIQDPDDVV